MDNFATLFLIFWVVFAVALCIAVEIVYPKRELIYKTKGYLVKDVWMFGSGVRRDDANRLTYRFTINGKEYKKTFYSIGTAEYTVDIVYNRGYIDARPEKLIPGNMRFGFKAFLCIIVAPVLSRFFVLYVLL